MGKVDEVDVEGFERRDEKLTSKLRMRLHPDSATRLNPRPPPNSIPENTMEL